MVEILRRLKPERNGAVTGEMEGRGVRYGLNYGVAIPVIRRVARDYAPDPALAEYLFRQDIRELKLAAVYVADPAAVAAEQMERWAGGMPADEIMEHAAMSLFYASPEAVLVIPAWLDADRTRQKGALHMAGRRAAAGLSSSDEAQAHWRRIEEMLEKNRELPQRAAVYALCRMAENHAPLFDAICHWAAGLPDDAPEPIREIAAEVSALLEYRGK